VKNIFLVIFFTLLSLASVEARDVAVRGYTKDNGTYVQPHYRSSPNEYKNDNWSTSGNSPHTGKSGTNTHKGTCSAYTSGC
jgi:hypothetical protein